MKPTTPYQERIAVVREHLAEWQVAGLLITGDSNRRWLSGFSGSSGKLLITADQALLATDFRYWEQAAVQAPDFTLFKHQRRTEDDQKLVAEAAVSRVGVEAKQTTLADYAKLKKVEGVTWVPLATTVEGLRQMKTVSEIEAIKAAAAITDTTMALVPQLARAGMSEKELAWKLEKALRENGADAIAFPVIVASGPNSALPHHHPGERVLQSSDPIIVDLGAQLGGYRSDLTRSFFLGNLPDETYREVFELVQAAQTAVLDQARPGMNAKGIDALARNVIGAAGHAEYFGHGLGHGVGLDIHEGPQLSRYAETDDPVRAGTVFTVEPGIYIPGWGGVRIEDLCHLTAAGLVPLSNCPKNPAIPA